MKKTGKKKAALSVTAVVFAILLLSGCSDSQASKTVDSGQVKASAEQASAEPIAENENETKSEKAAKRTVQLDLSDEENEETVLNFGSDTVFGGIEVETDESGELVCIDQGGTVWYQVTDRRFSSYSQLSRFVRKNMSSGEADTFLREADAYFVTDSGSLYLVDGAGGRTISNTKRYVMNGGSAVKVSASHTAECRRKYGITRSSVDFVKSEGTWKLDSIHYS